MINHDAFQARIKELYHPPQHRFTTIDVPPARYMAIDGHGDPEKTGVAAAMKWLYGVVYLITPFAKQQMGSKFAYPPPEFLLWADDPKDFISGNKDEWRWRVMIVLADFMSDAFITECGEKMKQKSSPPSSPLHIIELHEGKSVQTMHVGDYSGVAKVCAKLYGEFLPQNNLTPNGIYHEIYLNDPTREAPKNRKIVIRQPVK